MGRALSGGAARGALRIAARAQRHRSVSHRMREHRGSLSSCLWPVTM